MITCDEVVAGADAWHVAAPATPRKRHTPG